MLDYERCHELFAVIEGALIRRDTGKEAGSLSGCGYRNVEFDGDQYRTHRVIFLMTHNYLPKFVDHKDGDKLNNDPDNLRGATRSQNGLNRVKTQGCSSMYKGVSWFTQSGKWKAQVRIDNNLIYLGLHDNDREAAMAYDSYMRENHHEFSTFNFPREGERSCLN